MAKRYGRNQKRRHREELAKQALYNAEQVARLHDEIDRQKILRGEAAKLYSVDGSLPELEQITNVFNYSITEYAETGRYEVTAELVCESTPEIPLAYRGHLQLAFKGRCFQVTNIDYHAFEANALRVDLSAVRQITEMRIEAHG